MVLCPILDRWTKSQNREGRSGILADDPAVTYLLGFEGDEVISLPVKTYIRRLWLAFQSGKAPVPKYFFNPQVHDFANQEIGHWVSTFANNPELLTAELRKARIDDEEGGNSRRAFLEETAKTILIDRQWGDTLWGPNRSPIYELLNEKREPGDNHPPRWPEDQDKIILAVRQWMAARLQHRLRKPVHKNVPRINCPDDPDQRRSAIAAVIEDFSRDDRTECDPEERIEMSDPDQELNEMEAPDSISSLTSIANTTPTRTEGILQPSPPFSGAEPANEEAQEYSRALVDPQERPLIVAVPGSAASDGVASGLGALSTPLSLKRKRNEEYVRGKRTRMSASATTLRSLPSPLTSGTDIMQLPTNNSRIFIGDCSPVPSPDFIGTRGSEHADQMSSMHVACVPMQQGSNRGLCSSQEPSQASSSATTQAQLPPLHPSPRVASKSPLPQDQTVQSSLGNEIPLQDDQSARTTRTDRAEIAQDIEVDFEQLGDPSADSDVSLLTTTPPDGLLTNSTFNVEHIRHINNDVSLPTTTPPDSQLTNFTFNVEHFRHINNYVSLPRTPPDSLLTTSTFNEEHCRHINTCAICHPTEPKTGECWSRSNGRLARKSI